MSDTCVKHSFEPAAGVCRQCHNSYCADCLVFAFGEKKPPYCVACALKVTGIRQHGAKPNPRLRKKGLFGRKVLVEEEPEKRLGFDDIKIQLPDEALSAPVMTRVTRNEVAPEVIAMVEAAEAAREPAMDTEPGGVAVATPEHPGDGDGSLAEWAASLAADTSDPGTSTGSDTADAWPDSSSIDAWPDDSTGRSF